MAKYSKKAAAKVARAMKKRKTGTLRSGGSGKKVTSKKQAIAIGLSEARAEGRKVPKAPKKKTATKKTTKKVARKTVKKAAKKTAKRAAKKSRKKNG